MKLSQDAILGTFFTTIGVVFGLIALNYPFGTAGRMGPGYFPVIVSTLLAVTGIAILMRARLATGEPVRAARWLPLVVVPLAVILFGLLVEKLGMPLAVMMLVVIAATASVKFRLNWMATAGAATFSAVCAIVFVELLGLPIPIIGTWLHAIGHF